MSKLVLSMGVSLDGLVARPARLAAGGWGLPPDDPSLKERKLGWMQDIGLHLMGRNTYDEMAGFWPTSDDPYAAPMNEIPKVVFSRTLEHAGWPDSRIARGALADEIAALKRESPDATDSRQDACWSAGRCSSLASVDLAHVWKGWRS